MRAGFIAWIAMALGMFSLALVQGNPEAPAGASGGAKIR